MEELIKRIQLALSKGEMSQQFVGKCIQELARLGFAYNYETFPVLADSSGWSNSSGDAPENLAEALLWKLGKWKSYKKFSKQYSDDDSVPTNTDVVFYAFARHLKNPDNPIYDQHAIRALWAISTSLTDDEKSKCKHLLLDKENKWKPTGSGRHAVNCYNIFVNNLNLVIEGGVSKSEVDRLLMPLGQAIKKRTKNYQEFCQLCGYD